MFLNPKYASKFHPMVSIDVFNISESVKAIVARKFVFLPNCSEAFNPKYHQRVPWLKKCRLIISENVLKDPPTQNFFFDKSN